MNKDRLFLEEGKTVDQIVTNLLLEEKMISESQYKLVTNLSILEESSTGVNRITQSGKIIDRDIFEAVYSNVSKYSTHEDILFVIGFNESDFSPEPKKRQDTMKKTVERIIKKFNAGVAASDLPSAYILPTWGQRKNFYTNKAKVEAGIEIEEPDLDSINAGSRSKNDRVTKAMNVINRRELLSGEFYANMTRIPRTRWGNWLRFWDKEKTSVQRDRTLLGREWGKSFILGYQVEPRVVYEIWYNSIDSTFTVHDINGMDVSSRVRTMNEATRNMIRMIAQQSDEDAEVFHGSSPESRLLARSIQQSLISNTDPRVKEFREIETKQAAKAKQEKIEQRKQQEETRERLRAAARSATTKGRDFFNKTAQDAAEMAKEQYDDVRHTAAKAPEAAKAAKEKVVNVTKAAAEKLKDVVDYQPYHATSRDDMVDIDQQAGDDKEKLVTPNTKGAKKTNRLNQSVLGKLKKRVDNAVQQSDAHQEKMDKIADENKRREAELKRKKELIEKEARNNPYLQSREELNESFGSQMSIVESFQDFAEISELDDDIQKETESKSYDREIDKLRQQAAKSPYTQGALRDTIMGQVETYDETRVHKHFNPSLFGGSLFRGRREPINLPTDRPNIFKRAKMSLLGQRFRADFVIGFTLADKVDVEVWYITEPNPEYNGRTNKKKTIASFYVFDITSGKVLRRYLPYYRNTLPVVMAKIGVL